MTPDELRERMAALPEPVTDREPPYWEYWRWQLWQYVTEGRDPHRFLDWPMVYHTMLQNHWLHIPADEVRAMGGWDRHGIFLQPGQFVPGDFLPGTPNSANLIHQGYNLWMWEQWTGRRIADLQTIVEVGGGYGALALVANRLGFRGRYIIYDLPEFLLLQEFFLSNLGVDVEYAAFNPKSKKKTPADLVIGCYSLSEMELPLRDKFLAAHPAEGYLFLYSDHFEHYDNVVYFEQELPHRLQHVFWEHRPAATPNSFYALGGVPGPAFYYKTNHVLVDGRPWYETVLTCPICGQLGVYTSPGTEVDYGGGDHHCCIHCGIKMHAWFSEHDDMRIPLRRALGKSDD